MISDPSRLNPQKTLILSPNRLPMFPLIYQVELIKDEFEARSAHDDEVERVAFSSLENDSGDDSIRRDLNCYYFSSIESLSYFSELTLRHKRIQLTKL